MEDFEPKIIGFLCNWCSYAGADLAGVSRFQYPTNIRVIRIMCSARVEPGILLDVLLKGADGIFVGGCHIGDCHYITGNYFAEKKIEMTKRLLKKTGVDERRLRLEWVSASEGERFSKVIAEFTDEIKTLGPSPLRNGKKAKEYLSLKAARNTALGHEIRILAGKQLMLMEENKYGEKFCEHEINRLYNYMVNDYINEKKILLTIECKPHSVKQISEITDIPPPVVLKQIIDLRNRGMVQLDKVENNSPLYVLKEGEK